MAGIFGSGDFWMPPQQQQPGTQSGVLGGAGMPNWASKLGIIGATLADAGANFAGHPADAVNLQKQLLMQRTAEQGSAKAAALEKLRTAQTPQERQSAAFELYAAGGDLAGLTEAMKFGQPTYMDPGENGKVAIDPFTGLPTGNKIGGTPKAPQSRQIQRGSSVVSQQFDPQTGQWQDIPNAIGPRFAPRADPKPPAAGAINIPHPGSMY